MKMAIDYGKIELLVLDVDGVLTDGTITLTEDGREIKQFHVRDGAGIKYWQRVGKKVAIITGRGSPVVTHRAKELGVEAVHLNAKDKIPAFEQVLSDFNMDKQQVAVIGDDLPDLPMFARAGFSAAPADAAEEVRQAADYVTTARGGAGCVREVVEMILKSTGQWQKIMERYLPDGEEK